MDEERFHCNEILMNSDLNLKPVAEFVPEEDINPNAETWLLVINDDFQTSLFWKSILRLASSVTSNHSQSVYIWVSWALQYIWICSACRGFHYFHCYYCCYWCYYFVIIICCSSSRERNSNIIFGFDSKAFLLIHVYIWRRKNNLLPPTFGVCKLSCLRFHYELR